MYRSEQYADGYRSGRLDASLGRQSRYAMATAGDYGEGYRAAQAEAARANYERTRAEVWAEYVKTEFRA